jgi:hypothetical protein
MSRKPTSRKNRRARRTRERVRALQRSGTTLYVSADPASLDPERALVALWRQQATRDMCCPVCGVEADLDGDLRVGELTIATFRHERFCPLVEEAS